MTKTPWIERIAKKSKWVGECAIFTGGVSGGTVPYGVLRNDDMRMEGTHITSYKKFNGAIPEGHIIRHTCHNSLCWRPEHLITGTQQENIDDKLAANRDFHAIGEEHHNSKLSDEETLEILRLCEQGATKPSVADQFGVSVSLVYQILQKKVRHRRLTLLT